MTETLFWLGFGWMIGTVLKAVKDDKAPPLDSVIINGVIFAAAATAHYVGY
jgi:hypothetical protein